MKQFFLFVTFLGVSSLLFQDSHAPKKGSKNNKAGIGGLGVQNFNKSPTHSHMNSHVSSVDSKSPSMANINSHMVTHIDSQRDSQGQNSPKDQGQKIPGEAKKRKDYIDDIINPKVSVNPIFRSPESLKRLSPFNQKYGPKRARKIWLNLSLNLFEPEKSSKEAVDMIKSGIGNILNTLEKIPDPETQLAVKGVKAAGEVVAGLVKAIDSAGLGISLKLKFMNADVHFRHINNNFFALIFSIAQLEGLEKSLKDKNLEDDVRKKITEEKNKILENIKKLSKSIYDSYGWLTGSSGSIFEPKWFNTLSADKQRMLIYIVDYGINFAPEKTVLIKEPVFQKFLQLSSRNTQESVGGIRKAAGQLFGNVLGGEDKMASMIIQEDTSK